jgi:amino acid adenylation domain-containing protein
MPENSNSSALLQQAERRLGHLTLGERIRARAAAEPEREAYVFLADGEADEQRLTYGGVDRRARAVAAVLQARGLAGERALLLFPPGLDYAAAFLGCLYAGTVAVPAYPPTGSRGLPRLSAILADCAPRAVLTVAALRATVERQLARSESPFALPALPFVDVDAVPDAAADGWRDPGLDAEDLAFLQYTSGSTSTPKGVRVSHGNLLANERMIQEAFATTAESVVVSWLPLYHDMGLIGGLLHPLYLGARCVLLSPLHFLQRPARWLEAISRHRATVSGGPNFAYELCARKVAAEEASALDLSAWRVAFNGAEPVRAEVLERFAAAFAGAGFRRAAFFPCYGLAEATLLVSGGRAAGQEPAVLAADAAALARDRVEEVAPEAAVELEEEKKVRRLVGCGRLPAGIEVRVVDPASGPGWTECAADAVGEIWVGGATVARGYWKRPQESAATFGARLADGRGPYLRTGDLGFVRGGELFVAGRGKDLILIRGRNLYPQDVEWTVERSHPALRPGCGAAFAVDDGGEERLVVVQEAAPREGAGLADVAAAIRGAVAEEHEVQVSALVLVKAGGVPKTTSGKVQRRACRDLFLAGALAALGEWREGEAAGGARVAPRTAAERRLAAVWEEVLGLAPGTVGAGDSFFALGGDSVRGVQLLARLQEAGVALGLEELFAAPVLAEMAARLEAKTEGGEPPRRAVLARAERGGPLPLTSPQRRLWFLDQLEPGNPAYNLAFTARVTGLLDVAALAAALAEVARRHEALRTVFGVVDGAPAQLVLPPAGVPLPLVDLSALPERERTAAAAAGERQGARRPFDLARGPLLAARLVRLGTGEHELQVAVHHIVCDGWSIGVLLREVAALYAAGAARRPSPLPALPVQYGDFARWQAERGADPALLAQLAAWRQRLSGSLPVLALPADRPRPPVQSYRGAHAVRVLPPALVAALSALAAGAVSGGGASPFMVLLAAFQALLLRVTAQQDLIVGTAVANRDRVELEGLIGFFVNTLPLRTDLSGDPPFSELLRRARATVLAALAHREVPFERLVDELQPRRDFSVTPIVQAMLVLQNAPLAAPSIPGLGLAAREVDNGTARFDLALSLLATETGLAAVWKYNRDLFDATTIARLAAGFETLLAAAVAAPGRRLSALPLLGAAARHQVVLEWNATAAAGLDEGCLHELFAAQAERTPEAEAAVYEGTSLTYRELDRRANQLARHLRRLGVGPESLVGVAVERSLELVVGLLGVLKAGGAYLPLDPSYPADRLAFMVDDARVPVLLTQERLRGGLPAGGARVLCLDSGWGAVAAERDTRPAGVATPENLAYAIYTSGSTGRPKGSMIAHRGIVNRLRWMQAEYGLTPGEGVLQKTPASFDVSVWEFFWPLLTGARLVLARPGGHQDSAYLAGLIAAERITTVHFVPSMLQVFLAEPRAVECTGLRRVIASGEALPRELAERFSELLGWAELHNLYGPTEASVDVTAWAWSRMPGGASRSGASESRPFGVPPAEGEETLAAEAAALPRGDAGGRAPLRPLRARPRQAPGDGRGVPIGRPIDNIAIRLLDRFGGEPVPIGVAGHLHIGGIGLARGYLGRPEMTAERFVPDPFGAPGGRLYATGDLARLRNDGAIEFLGRIDHQVKIRGFRIELGEIEAALNGHPAVRETVVLARRSAEDGPRRLVAYWVGRGEKAEAEELRAFLAARLPEHMVPSAFVALDAFPLGPSGKVDRQALPAPAEERGEEMEWTSPRTPLEARLAAMWSEQLGVARVGAHDGFFALGGDSIQGALFVNRLQRELDAIVYVMALFDHPTVARFAAYLQASHGAALAAAGWIAAAPREAAVVADAADADDEQALARFVATRFSAPEEEEVEPAAKNRPAVFLLSPFRSGSTLLRVMLAGHPRLFAPPELELLGFLTMGERERTFSGRDRFSREGLLRAVMELEECGPEEAAARVEAAAARDEPTREFYRRLQEKAGERVLVDKTPRYALDLPALRRAERWFAEPFYVHLVRHPGGTIHSYLEARMDEVYRFPLPRRRQAELVWRRSHENVLEHLAAVPARRQHRLRFEDLVRDPRGEMEALCRFLGLEFHPAMLSPYEGGRMTDGLHDAGRMMGDPKFHRHGRIEAAVADRWRAATRLGLGEASWRLAERLGYQRPESGARLQPLYPTSRPRAGAIDLPLSFAQQRIWFLDRLLPGGSAYNMPAAVRLAGRLDVAALAASCAEIERRHEVLRTVFPADGGRPRQVVRAPGAVPLPLLPIIDLGALPEPLRQAESARRVAAEFHAPFDLAVGPLWRVRLLRLAADEHVLLVNLHHMVCDGWSVGVLTRELAALYEAFRAGAPSPLPEPELQYADYAAWQRAHLSGEVLEELLHYWRERLAAPPPVLELPLDRPRPAVQTHRGARLAVAVPPELAAASRAFGRAEGATPFMVLAAAFDALLNRYSGQDDLLVGTPVANRNRAEVEGLIGLFVNTAVLRVDLGGDPDARALLGRVRQACLGAARHEEMPFEKLVEELGVERSLGHSPLFVVMLALQNAPPARLDLPGLALERLDVATRTAKFDLTLDLAERHDGQLAGALEYNADLFDEATVARLARHFQALLAGLAAGAGHLSTLPLLSAAERHELVVAANDTRAPLPSEATVHEWVAATARRVPDAVAVAAEGQWLSYGELAARAGRLAGHLARLGVGPEVAVAVCAERSPALLVGLLAVLEAGGAYVPLDPTLPRERLAYILADAAAPVLLAERELLPALPANQGQLVLLDEQEGGEESSSTRAGESAAEASEDGAQLSEPAGRVHEHRPQLAPPRSGGRPLPLPENLAYVIYTSGSTGRPKGVEVRHRGVVNYLASMARRPSLAAGDVVVAVTTLAFDIAVTELFLPLAVGARVELVRRETAGDAARLAAALADAGATCLQATPTTWGMLLDGGWPGRPGLVALCGGEALPRPLADRLLPRVAALWNVYGPTETTVWSTLHAVAPGDGAVPIGRPLANTEAHLLGRRGELVPPGAAGELAIGGEGLARGYRGRPDLTAGRFVPDPFGPPGARLYRTGDLARRLPGGEIEYLGRIDHQVKIRGFRIETAEVEAVLLEHPAVRQAVALARGESAADRRLVAYVVKAPEREVAWEELRGFLRQKLPLYMVPAALVFLDLLPLLPSGKVDRKSLPDPGRDRPDLAASYVSPANERERLIAQVWQEVLGLDRVGVHDNFFDLGGHSLLAAEVHGKLRERLPSDLTLIDLFRHPTVHALAGRLRGPEPAGAPLAGLKDLARKEREASQRRRKALARRREAS